MPSSYSHANQEWGNPNWAHHQGWECQAPNNQEDWAAKAKAWVATNNATGDQYPQSHFTPVGRPEEQSQYHDQHSQSQFTPAGRPEEQSQYHDQYAQSVGLHYPESQQQSLPTSSYLQFSVSNAPLQRPLGGHLQESASISYGPLSYVPDERFAYTGRNFSGESNAVFPHQNSSSSPTVHQQEVPSSYSSITGNEESLSLPNISAQSGQHYMQSSAPVVSRSVLMDQPFVYGNQSTDPADQPLDFAPRYSRDHDPHMQSSYTHPDSAGPIRGMDPSVHTWTPPSGVTYPPLHSSGPQHDPSVAVPSVPAPAFGRLPGPSFQPTFSSASSSFSLGAGTQLHSTTAFSSDAYGLSSISERPKKASVPNWLREEIIKKVVNEGSVQEHHKEETQSVEDEGVDKSLGKGDQADSKSLDSSRSTEEEDDDEDYVEAARTAAINQEIKRVLTEVLLKVTDELFDEIATNVLNEDDTEVEVEHNTVTSNHRVSQSLPAVPTSKVSAKVLIPLNAKETEIEDVSGKSTFRSPGDLLGLASYASDEDNDDEIQSPSMPNSGRNPSKHAAVENGSSEVRLKHTRDQTNLENNSRKSSPIRERNSQKAVNSEHAKFVPAYSSKVVLGVIEDATNVGGDMLGGISASNSKYNVGEKVIREVEQLENFDATKLMPDDSQGIGTRVKSGTSDRYESKRISAGIDFAKEVDSGKIRAGDNRGRPDGRHVKKEKTDDWNGSRERKNEQGAKPREKAKESDSRKKSSHFDVKEDRKDMERSKRPSARDDNDRKRERSKDEREDRSRHKPASDSSRNKRRHSPSPSSRGRNGKDSSASHANDSSDEGSEDSRRKPHSKRRDLSPSPVKSKRRQVSRSPPHSKHSQRRHSPYSSLETSRKKRSRSKSPVRRR